VHYHLWGVAGKTTYTDIEATKNRLGAYRPNLFTHLADPEKVLIFQTLGIMPTLNSISMPKGHGIALTP